MTPVASLRHRAASGGTAGYGSVVRSALAKLTMTGVSGLISVVTVRLVIQNFGVEAYAQYGLLVSVAALLPFADLGLGSVLLNAVAATDEPDRDEHLRRILVSVVRVILVSAAVITVLALVLTIAGAWPALLGSGLISGAGPLAAMLCLVVFAATLPLAVGQRLLTALGLNSTRILLQGLASPLFAGSVAVLVVTGARGGAYLAVFSYLGGAVIAAGGCVVAARRLPATSRAVLRDLPRLRAVPGEPVMGVAWPVLVTMVALAVAMQTDRLLISHLASPAVLAEYNLAFSLFSILLQTINAAGVALWPVFARARSAARVTSPWPLTGAFAVAGLAVGSVLAVLVPEVGPLLSNGQIAVGAWTTWSFVAFVAVQAAKYPLGMYMTDERGLRFQVVPVLVMVPLNLGLSWVLVAPLGAGGPIVGSTVSVVLCQLLPSWWYVSRDLDQRRAAAAV